MRNTWLIIRREYLERVRTKAFLLFTVLMPVFVVLVVLVPSKLAMMKTGSVRNVVIVASSQDIASAVKQQLEDLGKIQSKGGDSSKQNNEDEDVAPKYVVETKIGGEELRKPLTADVAAGKIDGYIWLTEDKISEKKFIYITKHASDFVDFSTVQGAVNSALIRSRLVAKGVASGQLDEALKRMDMDVMRIDKTGKESKSGGMAAIMLPFLLMFMIYMTVLIYGIAVMRSVLEEKTSRVMEVMLSSANSTQMMAGKILGVGAVGATQVLIWMSTVLLTSLYGAAVAAPYLRDAQLSPLVYVCFPVFFLLGYLLYSSMYAAVGAMVNSEEEAQQMQWPVMIPLILCTVFAMTVIRDPNSNVAFWASIFPFTAPIVMFLRVVVQQPPMWQIGLSIGLVIVSIWGMVWLCSRIYRVGILMYGKRPTLPEIMKWIKYA